MPHVEKSATIHRDPKTTWAFLTHRENAPLVVPNLVRVWDIAPAGAALGQSWKFEFRLLGLSIEGTARIVEFEAGKHYAFQTSNSVESRWTYVIAPEGAHTRLTVAVDYTLPDTLWARIKDKLVLSRIHESQVEELLVNVEAALA